MASRRMRFAIIFSRSLLQHSKSETRWYAFPRR